MAASKLARKTSDRFFTRTEARRLSGAPDNHAFREYAASGLIQPVRLANGYWLYSARDVQAIRNERRSRGRPVPVVEGFD
jgi:hypothetical protein